MPCHIGNFHLETIRTSGTSIRISHVPPRTAPRERDTEALRDEALSAATRINDVLTVKLSFLCYSLSIHRSWKCGLAIMLLRCSLKYHMQCALSITTVLGATRITNSTQISGRVRFREFINRVVFQKDFSTPATTLPLLSRHSLRKSKKKRVHSVCHSSFRMPSLSFCTPKCWNRPCI